MYFSRPTAEEIQIKKMAKRPALLLTAFPLILSFLPVILIIYAPKLPQDKLEVLGGLAMILSTVIQLVSHLILSKLILIKSLMSTARPLHLVALTERKFLKSYFWGWYLRFFALFIAACTIMIVVSLYVVDLSKSPVVGLFVFYGINWVSIYALVARLLRNNMVSINQEAAQATISN